MTGKPVPEPPTILIADDDIVTRSVTGAVLSKLGFGLRLAEGATDTLQFARQDEVPALVLLDLNMPGNGLEVCRTLRADPRLDHTPIAILTARSDDETRQACVDAGATLFLTKPFNPASLLQELAPHLELDGKASAALDRAVAEDDGDQHQDFFSLENRAALAAASQGRRGWRKTLGSVLRLGFSA